MLVCVIPTMCKPNNVNNSWSLLLKFEEQIYVTFIGVMPNLYTIANVRKETVISLSCRCLTLDFTAILFSIFDCMQGSYLRFSAYIITKNSKQKSLFILSLNITVTDLNFYQGIFFTSLSSFLSRALKNHQQTV